MISPNSRYKSIDTATFMRSDGRVHPYLRRRFLPDPSDSVIIAEYVIAGGDRLDIVTAKYLGDPELFWLICDANNAMEPEELEPVGVRLSIPLPQKS
jgi:hypothetical protein